MRKGKDNLRLLKAPTSPFRSMIIIGFGFIFAVVLYNIIVKPRDIHEIDAAFDVNQIDALMAPDDSSNLYADSDSILFETTNKRMSLKLNGFIMQTGFTKEWKAREADGSIILINSKSNLACQAYLSSIDDYNSMIRPFGGNLIESQKQIALETSKLTAPGAQVYLETEQFSPESMIRERIDFLLSIKILLGSKFSRQKRFGSWVFDHAQAASLLCVDPNSNPSENQSLSLIMKRFAFGP